MGNLNCSCTKADNELRLMEAARSELKFQGPKGQRDADDNETISITSDQAEVGCKFTFCRSKLDVYSQL